MMSKPISTATLCVSAALAFAPAAFAQTPTQQSAWVSAQGSDVATCGAVTTPCRSFQYTHDNIVIAGGQIRVHDPAGYGALTITKSISIINDGVGVAGISAPTGNAITINAPGDDIFIKGLSLDGAGTGTGGIVVQSAFRVTVTNATITGFSGSAGAGISAPSSILLELFDSFIVNNVNGVSLGSSALMLISHNRIINSKTADINCVPNNLNPISTTKDNVISYTAFCTFSSLSLQ